MQISPIILDADGVLLNYVDAFLAWSRKQGYCPIASGEEDIVDYNLSRVFPGVEKQEFLKLMGDFSLSSDFAEIAPYPGAVREIEKLRDAHPNRPCVCVTSAGSGPAVAAARRANLRCFPLDEVIVSPLGASKTDTFASIGLGGVVLDDLPQHVTDAVATGHHGILLTRPWNRREELASGHRVESLAEACKHIEKLFCANAPSPAP